MAAILNVIGGIDDAIANKIDKSSKSGFKLLGYTFSWLTLINEAALERLGGLGAYLKAAKGATSLWYPLDTFVKANKFRHVISGPLETRTDARTGRVTTALEKVSMATLDLFIPLCDAARVFHDFSVWNLDKVAPFFSSFSLKQLFGTVGSMSLAIRFAVRSSDSWNLINTINREIETHNIESPKTIPQLENERTKTYCELAGRITLVALGIILAAASITGVFYWPPVLVCASISLLSDFAAQYFKDREAILVPA